MEKSPFGNNDRAAEHTKMLPGMYARVEGELVKILSTDERSKTAAVQFGEQGDVEHISYDKLATLVTTDAITDEWNEGSAPPLKKAA